MSDTSTKNALEELLDTLESRPVVRPADVVPILRILCTGYPELEHRVELVELAVRGLAYEPVAEPAADDEDRPRTTVFGVRVRLRPGFTPGDVREVINRLAPGLSGPQVVDELERLNVLAREEG